MRWHPSSARWAGRGRIRKERQPANQGLAALRPWQPLWPLRGLAVWFRQDGSLFLPARQGARPLPGAQVAQRTSPWLWWAAIPPRPEGGPTSGTCPGWVWRMGLVRPPGGRAGEGTGSRGLLRCAPGNDRGPSGASLSAARIKPLSAARIKPLSAARISRASAAGNRWVLASSRPGIGTQYGRYRHRVSRLPGGNNSRV